MNQGVRAGHPDLRKAQRQFKQGYWLKSSGSSHMIVMGPDGEPVRRNDGSGRHLGLPSSPRPSSISYHLQRLRDHGVLQQHEEGVAVRNTERLIRDDVKQAEPETNNRETNQLRQDLIGVKISKPQNLRGYAELVDIVSYVSATEPYEVNQYVTKLYGGMTLTEDERAPFVQLLALLEEEEDPIRARFSLLRKARGLPPQEEEVVVEAEPEQEVVPVSAIDDMQRFAEEAGAGTVEKLVGTFISDLRDQVSIKMEEINKIEDLITTLEEQYPSIQIEAETASTRHEDAKAADGNGGVSRTLTVAPEPDTGDETRRQASNASKGGRLKPEQVQTMIDQGGEWTLRELAEGLGFTEPTISRAVQQLIESGDVVVVTPSHMGHGGRRPGTYGSTKFFSK